MVRICAKSRQVALEIFESNELPPGFQADADLIIPLLRTGNQELRLRAYLVLSRISLAPGVSETIEALDPEMKGRHV